MYQIASGANFIIDYEVFPNFSFIKDINNRDDRIERLKFHVKSDDYFATLATIIKVCAEEKTVPKKIFSKLVEDLLYLQENYQINEK
jgi:hypothetical protein